MWIYVIARNGGDNVKKRYVRYRLISESSIIEQNGGKHQKPDASEKTALQLLGDAAKLVGGATAEATKLVFASLKQISGTIIIWIREFIKKIPSIATKTFNIVRNIVQKFWSIFGKHFFNILFGLAGICATLIESIDKFLVKTLRKVSNLKFESVCAPNFGFNDRMIKILNEATNNNPGMTRKVINNVIENAEPACEKVFHRCVNNNVAKTNSELACVIGASTILICGHHNLNVANGKKTNYRR